MKIAIFGGGFGLYGYLPALIQTCQATVLLPDRYQPIVKERQDICKYYDKIQWEKDESILGKCNGVVIALPPTQQYNLVKKCLLYKNITHYFLEKPLAASPVLAAEIHDSLRSLHKSFRIGYYFRYTAWAKTLLQQARGAKSIRWNFRAHHYHQQIQTWKRLHEQGGGALRFYGIHLIALMAEAGYQDVSFSNVKGNNPQEAEVWDAEFTGKDLTPCQVSVASNCPEPSFIVKDADDQVYSAIEPFQVKNNEVSGISDQRIPYIQENILDLFHNKENPDHWYHHTNVLWHKIERLQS